MFTKSLFAFVLSSSLSLFANNSLANSNVPLSADGGVRTDYIENSGILAGAFNLIKYMNWSLNGYDRETHIRTVMYALTALETGQQAQWYNPETKSGARIQIVMTSPVQGGFCRTFFTQVEIDHQRRDYTERGCKTLDSQFWSFSVR